MINVKKNAFMYIIIVFMYLFGFSIKGGHGLDSTMIIAVGIFIYACKNKQYMSTLLALIKNRIIQFIVLFYGLINIWICVCLIVNHSRDVSFMKTFLHVFFQIGVGILLYKFLEFRKEKDNVMNYIIIAFALQTTIQWGAFFIPAVRKIIYFTKSTEIVEKSMSYSGIRAIALSDTNFFGLSAAYALIALLYWSEKNTIFQKNRMIKMAFYCFLMSGTFFAGRTGFVGILFAIVYCVIKNILCSKKGKREFTDNEKKVAKIFLVLGGISLGVSTMLYFCVEKFRNLINFAFQPIIELVSNGTMMISSMEKLLDMYIDIPRSAWLFGHGKYDGYYMNTDVGYHRVILYIGVIGFLMLLIMQLFILQLNKGKEKMLKWMLLALLLTLNLKGEVITWAMIVLSIGLLFSFQDSQCIDSTIYET